MGGTDDTGPRKLASIDQKNYKEMGNTQAVAAKEKV